ncbi:S9 family peptidase [Aliidiomarina minuta]|uniref:S9 family peptidase n=1 Tax=Aliidiomarina minuta TaxID=880057 RepID=A0A432W735_9GAMM|nr:S9 family peptidase [Aliidiomarina minuta]RUO25890.1 S9 family peptidase [Aliidiomarina minuta]
MKRILSLLAGLLITSTASAETQAVPTLEDYARHAHIITAKISPNGTYLAFTNRDDEGIVRLAVLERETMEPLSNAELTGNDSISDFNWATDERLIINVARERGTFEGARPTGELYAMNADGTRPVMLTGRRSESRDRASTSVLDWLPNDDLRVLISSFSWESREPVMEVYRMRVDTGHKRLVDRAPLRAGRGSGVRVLTDRDGNLRVAIGMDSSAEVNENVILFRPEPDADWEELQRQVSFQNSFEPLAFSEDNQSLYALSQLQQDTTALSLFDLKTGEEEVLVSHPYVDLSPIFSLRGGRANEIIGASYEFDVLDSVFFGGIEDVSFSQAYQGLEQAFPDQQVTITSATRDDNLMVVSVGSANHIRQFYLFDIEAGQLVNLFTGSPWLAEKALPQTEIITYEARDGLLIQGLLTLPVNASSDLPLVMLPHGGPHGVRDSIRSMDRDAKVLASHGYAVLQPNFRGSGGFGGEFLRAGFRNWGTSMIDDMTDGVMHLIEGGTVNQERVCVYGGSYGGYAALMSAVREPELYKCAIGFVGVYDLPLMFDAGDIPESGFGQNYLNLVLGNDQEALEGQSPLHRIDELKAPVFIIHGARDERVPIEHANRLRDALEERDHPYEWLVKSREGHGFVKPENNVERWERMLDFLNRYIGEEAELASSELD